MLSNCTVWTLQIWHEAKKGQGPKEINLIGNFYPLNTHSRAHVSRFANFFFGIECWQQFLYSCFALLFIALVWDLSLHLSFFYFVFNPLGLVKLVWPSYPASSTLYNKRQRSSYRLQKSKLIKLGYFCMKKLKIFHVHCIANIPTLDDWYDKKVDWKKIEKHENIFLKHCLFHEIYFETWIIIYCMRDE